VPAKLDRKFFIRFRAMAKYKASFSAFYSFAVDLFESPNSIKINERSRFLYMPNWTLDELLVVAEEENLDANAVKETYDKLGGIMRYALRTKDRDRGKGFGRIMPR
jgi:hypothetical protein